MSSPTQTPSGLLADPWYPQDHDVGSAAGCHRDTWTRTTRETMKTSRRTFLRASAAGTAAALIPHDQAAGDSPLTPGLRRQPPQATTDRFDPWVEVESEALAHNVGEVGRLSSGRPILAVVKNNAYGLEVTTTAALLEPMASVAGFAVVKAEAAENRYPTDSCGRVRRSGLQSGTDPRARDRSPPSRTPTPRSPLNEP